MAYQIPLCVFVALASIFGSSAVSVADEPLVGFKLGASFLEAKEHANSKGWQLVALSENLPGQWIVEEQDISLFVCEGKITGISQQHPPDLDAFTKTVFETSQKLGEPDVKIVSFMSGVGRISTVDARFRTSEGGVRISLSSTVGEMGMTINRWTDSSCES